MTEQWCYLLHLRKYKTLVGCKVVLSLCAHLNMDLNALCRLCAKEDRLCIQVFGNEGIKQNVAKKIRLCLPIIVKESDDFPKQICLNCLSNLDTSYELYTRCLEAQSIIKNMIMVSRQNRGEIVKVYSTQELLIMMNKLRDKMCEKRKAVRLGNTLFTIVDAGSETGDSNNDEQKAKKRKQEVMKTSGRHMMYTAGPAGQRYMLIPSTAMPPTRMIPSFPDGQFPITPLPTSRTYPVSSAQIVPQTPISRASVVQTNNSDIQILPSELIPQTSKVTTTSTPQINAVPFSASATHRRSSTEIATVQSIQHVPQTPTSHSSKLLQGRMPEVTSASESTVLPQIISIQSATGTFQNSSKVQPTMSSQIPVSSGFTLTNRTGITIQAKQKRARLEVEESPSEILPHSSSDALGLKELLSTSPGIPCQTATQGTLQSQSVPLMLKVGDADNNHNNEDAANDLDPLHVNSEEEEQNNTEDDTAANLTVMEPVLHSHDKNRNMIPVTVQELRSNGSDAGGQIKKKTCPYCKISFPEDVIFHHKKLHFRKKVYSCVACNKNFQTETGLEAHHCE